MLPLSFVANLKCGAVAKIGTLAQLAKTNKCKKKKNIEAINAMKKIELLIQKLPNDFNCTVQSTKEHKQ